jgi:hypothetical protein
VAEVKLIAGTIVSMATTELNALGNGAAALGVEVDNSTALDLFGIFELAVTFGSAPTAGSTVDLYLIVSVDGTNYTDAITGASGSAPATAFVGSFPLRAVTTAQRIPLGLGVSGYVQIPPRKIKGFVINRAGVAFPASGSTLKMVPYRYQVV